MAKDPLQKALRISYLISFSFGLLLSAAFFAVTTLSGDYNMLARYGGALWILILGLVVALPTVAPRVKRRYRE